MSISIFLQGLLVLSIVALLIITSRSGSCEALKDFKQKGIYGIVKTKYVDIDNHSYPVIETTEASKLDKIILSYNGVKDRLLYQSVEIGDTIVKDIGSIDVCILRFKEKKCFQIDLGCETVSQ